LGFIFEGRFCLSGIFSVFRQYLLIGYLDVNWDSSIIFGLLKEGFYNEVVIFFFFFETKRTSIQAPEGITLDQKANTGQKKFKHARRPIVTGDKETPPTKLGNTRLKSSYQR
jgi:hypothetical protein